MFNQLNLPQVDSNQVVEKLQETTFSIIATGLNKAGLE
jgi:hypothetical protein